MFSSLTGICKVEPLKITKTMPLRGEERTSSSQINDKITNCIPCFVPSGVADGVGGWRDYGVDPSQFSATLMRTCERLVKEGRFTPSYPVGILTSGYYELLQNKVPLLGE